MKLNLFACKGLAASALLLVPIVSSRADQVVADQVAPAITQEHTTTVVPAPVTTQERTTTVTPVAPAVAQERTTTVTPAPVVTEHHESATTTTTTTTPHKLTHEEKKQMEKDRDMKKDIEKANRERDEKVRDAVEDAR